MESGFQRRSRRLLVVCFIASFSLHVVAFAVLPGLVSDHEPPNVRVLDVVLLKPDAPPVAGPEPPQPLPPVPRQPARQRASMPKKKAHDFPPPQAEEPRRLETKSPEFALPEPRPDPGLGVSSPPPAAASGVGQPKTDLASGQGDAAAITPPGLNAKYLRNPPPQYPLIARRNGEQGTVMLRVLVTREGVPANVSVEKTSGSGHLDSAALETVKTWRFVPARQGAQPVDAWVLVPIVFRLEGSS